MTRRSDTRRAFTMIELLLAGLLTAFVLGVVSVSLSQLSSAKRTGRLHLEACLRADAALTAVRRDVISTLRDRDLFWTRLLLADGSLRSREGRLDRDEILVYNAKLQPVHDLDFIGDGMEFETQFRVEEDDLGPVLWRRRDVMPDEYPRGGGVATPMVDGVIGLSLEAYDGEQWYEEWDSDYDGIPWAIRVTVTASGHAPGEDVFDAPITSLRTVIPLDRVPLPFEPPDEEPEGEQEGDEQADEQLEGGGQDTGLPGPDLPGVPPDLQVPGGGGGGGAPRTAPPGGGRDTRNRGGGGGGGGGRARSRQ